MFRKTINILLITVFLLTSVGFSITRHYCGNRLIKISLAHVENCCPYCKKCHNKVNNIKITDSYNSYSGNFSLTTALTFTSIPTHCYVSLLSMFNFNSSVYSDVSPPPLRFDNCFLQVFRN